METTTPGYQFANFHNQDILSEIQRVYSVFFGTLIGMGGDLDEERMLASFDPIAAKSHSKADFTTVLELADTIDLSRDVEAELNQAYFNLDVTRAQQYRTRANALWLDIYGAQVNKGYLAAKSRLLDSPSLENSNFIGFLLDDIQSEKADYDGYGKFMDIVARRDRNERITSIYRYIYFAFHALQRFLDRTEDTRNLPEASNLLGSNFMVQTPQQASIHEETPPAAELTVETATPSLSHSEIAYLFIYNGWLLTDANVLDKVRKYGQSSPRAYRYYYKYWIPVSDAGKQLTRTSTRDAVKNIEKVLKHPDLTDDGRKQSLQDLNKAKENKGKR